MDMLIGKWKWRKLKMNDREIANIIERAFSIWLGRIDGFTETQLNQIIPTDEDCLELSKEIIEDINKLKKWVV